MNIPLINLPHSSSPLQHSEWSGCGHAQMEVMEAVISLDQLVDESDPDVDFPNSYHAFQTAEGIRREHPHKGKHTHTHTQVRMHTWFTTPILISRPSPDWFQLVGLIHDIGKIMALSGEPQVNASRCYPDTGCDARLR